MWKLHKNDVPVRVFTESLSMYKSPRIVLAIPSQSC